MQLFNLALARLGGEQLDTHAGIQEGDTLGALCQTCFAPLLDRALYAHAWSFALRRVALASVQPSLPDPLWPYAFALPADCVRPVRLAGAEGLNRSPAYIIEGDTLRAQSAGATLVYVRRVTDPRAWPPDFADALAWGLAAELASAKLNNSQKQQWAMQNFQLAQDTAIARDCAAQNRLAPVSAWKAARFGGAAPHPERY